MIIAKKNIQVPGWIKKSFLICISGIILFYYFHSYNWLDVLDAVKRSNFILAFISILIPQLFFWYIEVYITKLHVNWFHGNFSFKDYFWIRGAIYFLVMINPSVGLGGIAFYVKNKAGMSWGKLFGILVFRYLLTIWGMSILLIPVTFIMKTHWINDYSGFNLKIWWVSLSFMVLWMFGTWLYWYNKKRHNLGVFSKGRKSEFWTAFRMATPKQWLITWLVGLAPYIVYIAGIYLQSYAFGMRIPLLRYIIVSPIAIVVADLPIAFSGFGTTTMSFVTFFGKYGLPESIAAFTLFLPFSRAVVRALIGLVSIRFASQEIDLILNKREKN